MKIQENRLKISYFQQFINIAGKVPENNYLSFVDQQSLKDNEKTKDISIFTRC